MNERIKENKLKFKNSDKLITVYIFSSNQVL